MGKVSRLRMEYRRFRRTSQRIQDAHTEAVEELADVLEAREAGEVSALIVGLDRMDEELMAADARLALAAVRLDDAIEDRKDKRREAWGKVRIALRQFGPAILDVVRDVLELASVDRPERLSVAVRSILEHTDIPLDEEQIGTVTELADRIVEALADDND